MAHLKHAPRASTSDQIASRSLRDHNQMIRGAARLRAHQGCLIAFVPTSLPHRSSIAAAGSDVGTNAIKR
eukprot:4425428-Pleurochrysis_carterae.AAC.1